MACERKDQAFRNLKDKGRKCDNKRYFFKKQLKAKFTVSLRVYNQRLLALKKRNQPSLEHCSARAPTAGYGVSSAFLLLMREPLRRAPNAAGAKGFRVSGTTFPAKGCQPLTNKAIHFYQTTLTGEGSRRPVFYACCPFTSTGGTH